jgi:hypothetical protein
VYTVVSEFPLACRGRVGLPKGVSIGRIRRAGATLWEPVPKEQPPR